MTEVLAMLGRMEPQITEIARVQSAHGTAITSQADAVMEIKADVKRLERDMIECDRKSARAMDIADGAKRIGTESKDHMDTLSGAIMRDVGTLARKIEEVHVQGRDASEALAKLKEHDDVLRKQDTVLGDLVTAQKVANALAIDAKERAKRQFYLLFACIGAAPVVGMFVYWILNHVKM